MGIIMSLINKLPIHVDTREVSNIRMLDICVGPIHIISLTTPEAIELIRKIEERL